MDAVITVYYKNNGEGTIFFAKKWMTAEGTLSIVHNKSGTMGVGKKIMTVIPFSSIDHFTVEDNEEN